MDLEIIMLSEVKERLISYDITYVWNIIKSTQIDFFTEQKQTHRPQSQTCVTRGQTWGKVIGWEFGIYINMLLCIKYITKRDLLYYTWKSTHYSVVVYVGNEPEKK